MSNAREEILELEQALNAASKEHNERVHDQYVLEQKMVKLEARIEKLSENITKCLEIIGEMIRPEAVVDPNIWVRARNTLADNRRLLQEALNNRLAGKLKKKALTKEIGLLENRIRELERKLGTFGKLLQFPEKSK